MKVYEFKGADYELNIERKVKVKCKVWEPKKKNSSVVVLAYGYGDNLETKRINTLAEDITKDNNVAVILIEYVGTDLKYSEDLLKRLENKLPMFLDNIKGYVPEKIKLLIQDKRYQDAINQLYFNAYINYPISKDTIIPLYGDENTYNDFGIAPSLDIIYTLINLKKIYTEWNWNDCIGYGEDYGAYLIEMVERLQPGTFSMILNVQGDLAPKKEDIFYNLVEWENGIQKNAHIKRIGRFPIYLVEVQGWTTAENHPNHFKPSHFDIRNLSNESLIKSNYNYKETPRIYIDLYNLNQEYLDKRKKYVNKLIDSGYSIEYFLVEENDIENYIFNKKDYNIIINLGRLFNYYFEGYCQRNDKDKINNRFLWYPVYGGVYLIYEDEELPKMIYLDKNRLYDKKNSRFNEMIKNCDEHGKILEYIENPSQEIDEEYISLID